MKTSYFNIALLATNLSILFLLITSQKTAEKTEVQPVIRAQMIELVDSKGMVRAQLKVEEDGAAMFRMRNSKGDVRVKLGADDSGSGLVLLDNETNVGIHALAKSKGSSVTVVNKNGVKKTLEP